MPPIGPRAIAESDGIQLGFGFAGFFASIISIMVAAATWQLQKRNTGVQGNFQDETLWIRKAKLPSRKWRVGGEPELRTQEVIK